MDEPVKTEESTPNINTVIDPAVMQMYYDATVNAGLTDINQLLISAFGTLESCATNEALAELVILNSKANNNQLSPEEAESFKQSMSEAQSVTQSPNELKEIQGIVLHLLSSLSGKSGNDIMAKAEELRSSGDTETLTDPKAFLNTLMNGTAKNKELTETTEPKLEEKTVITKEAGGTEPEPTISLDKVVKKRKPIPANASNRQKQLAMRAKMEQAIKNGRL